MLVSNLERAEKEARRVQREIWDHQASLWPGQSLSPLQMFTPETAARVLGLSFEIGDLGLFGSRDGRFQVAGVIDRQRGLIGVSDRFSRQIIRFTGAHEVGHWVLHDRLVMHRDRPIAGVTGPRSYRSPEEREADYFAACYLVPKKMAVRAFEFRFGTRCLRLDEDTAFHLCGDTAEMLLSADEGSLDFELALAGAMTYKGHHFDAMTKVFDVSTPTMAIRLKELALTAA